MNRRRVALLPTGATNTASMRAAFERLGARVGVASCPAAVRDEGLLVVPGVGAFGAAMSTLRRDGLLEPLAERLRAERPTLLVCLGLQLLAAGSEESPGIPGMGLLRGRATPFARGLRSPQQGWNRVAPECGCRLVVPGHAYFSNGFRLTGPPAGWQVAWSEHGGRFIAALERGPLLACQFHPELSGDWGAALLERWLTTALPGRRARATDSTPANHRGRRTRPEADGVSGDPSLRVRPPETLPRGRRSNARPALVRRPLRALCQSHLAVRLVPCLDVRDGRVVKGVRFGELRDTGDPAELAALYAAAGADELVLLDVSATPEGRATAAGTVRAVRDALPVPLTVGGGVRSVDDAVRLLDAGADKVAVNTAAVENPDLLTTLAARCGRQCVVASVDAVRGESRRGWHVIIRSGRRPLPLDAVVWSRRAVEAGAGEILLTSWDRDGTGNGYDEELIAAVRAEVDVPVIASGGAGSAEHLVAAVAAGADAVLLASRLHRGELTIAGLKSFLARRCVEVRP